MDTHEMLHRVAGECRATNWMVMLLIATHPDPVRLQQSFRAASPEWIDELADHPSAQTPSPFHHAIQDRLAEYTEVIDAAVRASGE